MGLFSRKTSEPVAPVRNPQTGAVLGTPGVVAVSAPDGPTPQTRQSMEELRDQGIPLSAVVITNCDKVFDEELIALVEMESRELANEVGLSGDNVPIARA